MANEWHSHPVLLALLDKSGTARAFGSARLIREIREIRGEKLPRKGSPIGRVTPGGHSASHLNANSSGRMPAGASAAGFARPRSSNRAAGGLGERNHNIPLVRYDPLTASVKFI